MADNELGELYGPVGRPRPSLSGWIGLVGTVTSLAMVGGVGVWSYKLMMRDINGVPVIRALEGPMRVAPADPGGERMAHQGLAVNQVAAAGEAGEISEQLTLAPPVPQLLEQDLAQAVLAAAPPANLSDATDSAVMLALDDTAEAGEVAPSVDEVRLEPVALQVPLELVPAGTPGVSRSPRPPARPGRAAGTLVAAPAGEAAAGTEASAASAPPPGAEVIELHADSLPIGSRLVQLGAFESPEVARAEWSRISDRFADVMAGKARVIQEASAGGKTFYRLRAAGFEDLADARRFCATLVADKSKPLCVPVATR